jgi:hypothetical protein
MIWYVAIVAIVNLALGYALAKLLGASGDRIAASAVGSVSDPELP